jgi:ribonuclease P protein component
MLPHSQRLSTAVFDEVFKSGRLVHTGLFTVKVKSTTGTSRFAVSVSKKIAKNAVDRNKIRRRTYSAIGVVLKGKKSIKKPICGVFVSKKGVEKASMDEIKADILAFFVKNGLLE